MAKVLSVDTESFNRVGHNKSINFADEQQDGEGLTDIYIYSTSTNSMV